MEFSMITKNYTKTGKVCRVTFRHIPTDETQKVRLLGEFNEWGSESDDQLKKRKDGSFSITLSIDAGKDYRFRYLLDDSTWENDDNADNYVPNIFGTKDAVISLPVLEA
jgi:1,4-alpha-glucan branching enzyme